MPINFKKFNLFNCGLFISIFIWMGLFLLQTYKWLPQEMISCFTARVELFIHIFTLIPLIKLYYNLALKDKKIIIWFLIANLALLLNDITFFSAVYLSNNQILSNSFFTFIIGYIPYLIWITSFIIYLSRILIREIFSLFLFFKALPWLIIINLLIILLFFSSVDYAFAFVSWECISHVMSFMAEFIIFDFALICLIYSTNRGFSFTIFGIIILISGDFFVNYSFLSQTIKLLSYGELLWCLGLIFILFGTCSIYFKKFYRIKDWFSKINSIKNKLAFWSFTTSSLSFLLFFTLAYFFTSIDKQFLLGLPIFLMFYSVLVIILSIIMGQRFVSPFLKLTANIESLMLNNDKSKIDNNFSTYEFIYLQEFILNAFKVKEQKERAQEAMIDLASQVAHDIRSPLAAINTVILSVTSISDQKRILIRNAATRINEIANNLLVHSKENFSLQPVPFLNHDMSSELIFVVLDNIVSEKRCEHNDLDIQIVFNVSSESYRSFVEINISSFTRVLSNLINNSIESIHLDGFIYINLNSADNFITIEIIDTGCGIPDEVY